MPFQSEKQRRYLWANEPEIAREWTDRYGAANGGIMDWVGQGGMKNYLGEQEMVNAPKHWQSAPDHEVTELAYITPKERDILVNLDLYNSMDGSPNEGPSGIMSLNGWGSTDESQNVSGAAASAAESGRHTADTLAAGMTDKDISDFRSAAINAGAGQTVNAGFFGPKYNQTVQPWEIEAAKTYRNDPANPFAKKAYSNTRGWRSHGFNPLGMMLGFINPALGMAVKGFQGLQNLGTKYGTKMGDWREKLTGYRTQDEWERARQNRINEKRMDYLSDRKAKGLGYGKQAYADLLSQGYSDSFQDAINKDLEINPETPQFARTHLQSKNLPENIKALDEYTTGSIDFNPGMTVGYGTGIEKIDPSVTQSYTSANDLPEEFQDLATHAKVTKQDLARYTPRTQKNLIDAQTYRSALDSGTINPNMTEFEFNKMREGLITQPGTYTEEDFA